MFKGSLPLLLDSCTTPLPAKLHALTHPPSLLANQERLWTLDLDKSQVRGRYNCIRDIRRSHCQPFCACVLLSRSEHMLVPSWSRETALSRFSVSCASVFGTGGLSVPTDRRAEPGKSVPECTCAPSACLPALNILPDKARWWEIDREFQVSWKLQK
jgi:hypothetical protein